MLLCQKLEKQKKRIVEYIVVDFVNNGIGGMYLTNSGFKRTKMKLYTSITVPNCPSCKMAKNLLNKYGIKYDEIVIGRDITKNEFLEEYGTEIRTVPQITVSGTVIGGYEELVKYLSSFYINND